MSPSANWYRNENFWRKVYPYMFDARRQRKTPSEVDGIVRLAALEKEDTILDLACGDGRHAIELARRGYAHLTGVDATQYYLELAKQRAATEGFIIPFEAGDMLSFTQEGAYDAILSLFSSFGYFENPDDNLRVLQNAYYSLKPGGKLVVDVRGKENVAYQFDDHGWFEVDGNYVLIKRLACNDFSILENHWTIIEQGRAEELVFSHWMYSAGELKDMCRRAGFETVAAYGGVDGSAYTHQSSRLIAVASKT